MTMSSNLEVVNRRVGYRGVAIDDMIKFHSTTSRPLPFLHLSFMSFSSNRLSRQSDGTSTSTAVLDDTHMATNLTSQMSIDDGGSGGLTRGVSMMGQTPEPERPGKTAAAAGGKEGLWNGNQEHELQLARRDGGKVGYVDSRGSGGARLHRSSLARLRCQLFPSFTVHIGIHVY